MSKNINNTGRVTLPAEEGIIEEIKKVIDIWGADAIRNSDGTSLSQELVDLGVKVYSTYLTTRNDQKWAKENADELQQLYLMSQPVTALDTNLEIDVMKGYYKEQFSLDKIHDVKKWWEVIDRTTGKVVPIENWCFNAENEKVIIKNAAAFHDYTVNFLVYQIWDPTQMYNHITNEWGDKPHEMPCDSRQPKTRKHVMEYLRQWLKDNPGVDVVRFTTFFHHFTLVFNEVAKEKFVDWFGYSSSVSPLALEEFEKEKGYKLTPEDIVDEGYYNSPFRVPSKEFKDYMDFQSRFASELAKEMVDLTHEYGKEAMMFLGDNWIGTEPYGKYFKSIGLDSVVGSVGNGVTLRMISDIPGVKYTEGRFLPYFFPDVFNETGDPVKEAKENWLQARRAILRSPLDRIGYGGYLSLAIKFPDFVNTVENICSEFRGIHENIKGTKAYTAPFKVAVLNCWGKVRSWQTNMVAHALWYKEIYSYVGVLECLSGMPIDVEFISFEDIKNHGISKDIGVIINAGDAYTAWTGGDNWLDKEIVTAIRKWVYNGGGFIGIGEPSAYQSQGKYFQLSDVLGVDKEICFGLSTRKYHNVENNHFILEDLNEAINFGESMKGIFRKGVNTKILRMHDNEIDLSVNEYGNGKSIYMSGLPYTAQNSRLLMRMLYWAASQEKEMKKWYVDNINTECAAFVDANKVAVINNTYEKQNTAFYMNGVKVHDLELEPMEIRWMDIR